MLTLLLAASLLTGCSLDPAPLPAAPAPQAPPAQPESAQPQTGAVALPSAPADPVKVPSPPGPAAPEGAGRAPIGMVPVGAERKVPVLMYHEIGDGPNELWVSEKSFKAQLAFLEERGYQSVTLRQLQAALEGRADLPSRPIVLTFDDGYSSHYSTAYPLLRKHGFSGVFFVYTSGVGRPNNVTWDQLREMQAAGMEIESHTVHHVDLAAVSARPDQLRRELADSRSTLQAELGAPVEYLCYPAGRYNAKVLEAVRRAGYLAAFTTKPGWTTSAQDPLQWRRVRINRSDTLTGFASKVGGPVTGTAVEKAAGGGHS